MPNTVSNLNKVYAKIEAWHNRLIEGERPYLYFDGIVMKRSWARSATYITSQAPQQVLGAPKELRQPAL
jgi:transposase-like protein